MNKPLVSISCLTYNHAPYIKQSLDGMLMQKADFPIEILIHDDASKDGTAEIIREYWRKSPSIIKPILEKENQWKKGNRGSAEFNFPRAKGNYIAICEGDDYWTDPYKLQKQVRFMERDGSCSLCVHAAKRIDAVSGKDLGLIQPSNINCEYSIREIIEGGGGLFSTNSMLFRTEYVEDKSSYFSKFSIADFPLTVILALNGNIYYMNDIMSVYRVNVPGSWTQRNSSTNQKVVQYTDIIKMLNELDQYTKNQFHNLFAERIIDFEFKLLLIQNKHRIACSNKYKKQFQALSLRRRLKTLLLSLSSQNNSVRK